MKLLRKLQQSIDFWFIFITSAIFFLLRLPSLFEPYWYGDEGIYEVIGFGLRHGRLLYSSIWDNKPPLLYLTYALFSGDQTGARVLSLLAGLAAVIGIFFLSKKLFAKTLPTYITTGLFAFLFAIPLIEGNIANAENFMLVLGIVAGYLVYTETTQTSNHHFPYKILNTKYFILFVAGLLLGLSFLYKVVGMFDLAAFVVFLGIIFLEKLSIAHIISTTRKIAPLTVGFLLPIIVCAFFFLIRGVFSIFLHSVLFSNVGYVNYGNQFIIPQGFLIFKTLLLGALVLFLFLQKNKFSKPALFILLWLAFSIYSALFSQRPYTHYMLVMLPSFALLVGYIFTKSKYYLVYGVLTVALLIFVTHAFSFYDKSLVYYQNFIQYVAGTKSTLSYQAFFDRVTPRDYQIAAFVNALPEDQKRIFVWGNSGQIYKLTNTLPPGRFIVGYHMTMSESNYTEIQKILMKNPPKFLIVLPNQDSLPIPLALYKEKVIIDNATIYEYAF